MFLLLVFNLFFGVDCDYKIDINLNDVVTQGKLKTWIDSFNTLKNCVDTLYEDVKLCANTTSVKAYCETSLKKALYLEFAFNKLLLTKNKIIESVSDSTQTVYVSKVLDLSSGISPVIENLKLIISGTVLHNLSAFKDPRFRFDLETVLKEVKTNLTTKTGHDVSDDSKFTKSVTLKILNKEKLDEQTFFDVLSISTDDAKKIEYAKFLAEYKNKDELSPEDPQSPSTAGKKTPTFVPGKAIKPNSNFAGSNSSSTDKNTNPNNYFVNPSDANKANQNQDYSGSGSFGGGFGSSSSGKLRDMDDRKERNKKRELQTLLQKTMQGIAGGRSYVSNPTSPRSLRGSRPAPNFAKAGSSNPAIKSPSYSQNYYPEQDSNYASNSRKTNDIDKNNPYLNNSKYDEKTQNNNSEPSSLTDEYSSLVSKLMSDAKRAVIIGDANKIISDRNSDIFQVISAVLQENLQKGNIAESEEELILHQVRGEQF